MVDAAKQENQKTFVAFVAGLLIGGLLVWVFSSAPSEAPATDESDMETDTAEMTQDEEIDTEDNGANAIDSQDDMSDEDDAPVVTNDESFSVSDQEAGGRVEIGTVAFPTADGWVAVRDYQNGEAGNILGASRYSTSVGLMPTSIALLRATEAGNTYQVVFYTENGDRVFDLDDDTLIEGMSATFTAQ